MEANHISIFITYCREIIFFLLVDESLLYKRTYKRFLVIYEREKDKRARNSIHTAAKLQKRRILCNQRAIVRMSAQINKNRMLIRNGLRQMKRTEKIATNLSNYNILLIQESRDRKNIHGLKIRVLLICIISLQSKPEIRRFTLHKFTCCLYILINIRLKITIWKMYK